MSEPTELFLANEHISALQTQLSNHKAVVEQEHRYSRFVSRIERMLDNGCSLQELKDVFWHEVKKPLSTIKEDN